MWVSLWVDRGNKDDNNNDNYVAVDWLTGVLLWLAAAVVCGCWRHICTIKILFRLISRRLLFSSEINYGKFFNVLCYLLSPKNFFILCGHVIYCCWQTFIELHLFGTGIRCHQFIALKLDYIYLRFSQNIHSQPTSQFIRKQNFNSQCVYETFF